MRVVESEIDKAFDAIQRGEPYEVVIAAIDRAARIATTEYEIAAVLHGRFTAVTVYNRPAAECEAVLDEYLPTIPALWVRGVAALAVCATFPEVAERRLDGIIAELEPAAADDPAVAKTLDSAYRLRARLADGE